MQFGRKSRRSEGRGRPIGRSGGALLGLSHGPPGVIREPLPSFALAQKRFAPPS